MTITGLQIREARRLLGWTSPVLRKRARVSVRKLIGAESDDTGAVSDFDLRAIREAFERYGIEFRSDGTVRLRGMA